MRATDLAAALFQAFERGDADAVRQLCATDLVAVQNLRNEMTLDELIHFTGAVLSAVSSFRYVDAIRTETSTGFVEEHGVEVGLTDGTTVTFAACVVGEVRDGHIVALRETVDGAGAAPLLRALAGGG